MQRAACGTQGGALVIDYFFPGGIHRPAPKAVIRETPTGWNVSRGSHFIGAYKTLEDAKRFAGDDATVEVKP